MVSYEVQGVFSVHRELHTMLVTNVYERNGDYSCRRVVDPRPLCFKAQAVSKKPTGKKCFGGMGTRLKKISPKTG